MSYNLTLNVTTTLIFIVIWYHCTDRIADDHSSPSEKIFLKFLTDNFRSIWFSCRNFMDFRLNGSLFVNSTISGLSGNFTRKFLYHLSPFPNFRNFWLNGKRPSSLARFRFATYVTQFKLSPESLSVPFRRTASSHRASGGSVSRLVVSTYRFNFCFLSFPAGQLCLCRLGFLH